MVKSNIEMNYFIFYLSLKMGDLTFIVLAMHQLNASNAMVGFPILSNAPSVYPFQLL